ncbi:hypothetical protein BN8_04569 [Fibrisoma limi BUZ 3]|uniref:Uncharacterized protein n=1 Tax=Fibrisoma limi BUZ 3 TaxID=1185876 RepID=I2GN41_9BACT|nr:hypothetical protein [Fibrisoma limi]CCH55319.1 hypothetical protein BN8_04569 [Fibrisoma limi BUZ 3]
MKTYYFASLLIFLATGMIAYGQANPDLSGSLRVVAAQLKPVKSSDKEFTQQLKSNGAQPYLAKIDVSEADKKGKKTDYVYELNLADIDPGSVKYAPKKDLMVISLKIVNNNDFVRVTENGQLRYDNTLTLYAENVDNARALTEALRQTPTAARKLLESRLNVGSSLTTLTDWLRKNVADATSGDESYRQTVALPDGVNPVKIRVTQQLTASKKTTEEVTDVNLGDLDPGEVKLGVTGKWVFIEAATRNRLNYIRHAEAGKPSNERSVRFYFADLEKAREGALVMQKLLPLAQQKQKEMAPVYRSSDDTQQRVVAATKAVGGVEQSLKPGCQTVLTVTEAGKTTEYRFDWANLNEKGVKTNASGKTFALELAMPTNQKYIEVWRNGQKQSYVGEIEIQVEDIETIRYLPDQLGKMILQCRENRKLGILTGSTDAKLTFIASKLAAVQTGRSTVTQQLDKAGGCTVKFTQNTNDGKKATDEQFEFSLGEIDPSAVELNTSGDEAYVQLTTRTKEKSIKAFKNGNPSNYVNSVRVFTNDIPTGMQLREGFRQAVEGCKK